MPNLEKGTAEKRLDELNAGDSNIPRWVSIAMPRSRDWIRIAHFAFLYSLISYLLIINGPYSHQSLGRNITHSVDLWSPAQGAVQYKKTLFEKQLLKRSPWTEIPSKELDAKWLSLYDFGITGISSKEAANLEDPTVKIPHNDSYAISLEVFHQLHCLDHLRKARYPDKYPDLWKYNPDHTVDHNTFLEYHWGKYNHCLDLLRQTLMCHADITPVPFYHKARDDSIHPLPRTTHMCRDYSKIQEWAASRQHRGVDTSNMGAMEEMIEAIRGDGD
ncbi:hypothetical protein F5884DRAFT_851384 [Xylogone sp. PMI_703]|nr:hypothetical protein F5884DRAFT_851384 [Xylogone sp. PMI_703]